MGPDHPGTLTTYGGLAVLLQSMGRLEDAEPFFRCDLDGSERVLGPEHPDTLTALHNLAGVLEAQGRSVSVCYCVLEVYESMTSFDIQIRSRLELYFRPPMI